MSKPPARAFALGLVAAIAIGCRSPAEQTSRRVVAAIANGSPGTAPLVLPDTVRVGVPFLVTVTTFGGACDQPDGADISTSGLLADVTPYDLLPPPETVCIAVLRASPRSMTLTLAVPGTGVVRVHGRRLGGGDVTLVGQVVVRP
jgi:hypothetical protein